MAPIASDTLSVTIDGAAVRPDAVTVDEVLAPGIDSARVRFPIGRVGSAGTVAERDPSIEVGDTLVVASSGGWSWSGTVRVVSEDNTGGRMSVAVEALGPADLLARTALNQWYRGTVLGYGVPTLNPGGVGNRSADPVGVEAYGCVRPADGELWTARDVLTTILEVSGCGLTLVEPWDFDGLTEVREWELDGKSVFDAIHAVLDPALGYRWHVEGTDLRVYGAAWMETNQVDLTDAGVSSYAFDLDGSSALESVVAVTSEDFVIATLVYDKAGGGSLVADWDADDVLALDAGDRASPAWRRFKIDETAALGDGTLVADCALLGVLPLVVDPSATREATAPRVFVEKTEGTMALAVKASPRRDGQDGLEIDGGDWETQARTADRILVTIAMRRPGLYGVEVGGGDGSGTRRVVTALRRVWVEPGTIWGRDVDGALRTEAAGTYLLDETGGLEAVAQAALDDAGHALGKLTWSQEGVAGGATRYAPGRNLTGATLPRVGSESYNAAWESVPIERRTVSGRGSSVSTTWSTSRPVVRKSLLT